MKTKLIQLLFFVFLLSLPETLFAVSSSLFPKEGKKIEDFVPAGWFILKQANGDLNQDGNADVALILASEKEKSIKPSEIAPDRYLLILFQNTQGYELSVSSLDVVLHKDDGGVWGDPLDNLQIKKGAVVLSFYGGSRDRWGEIYRFRFQNGDWYIIGRTTFAHDSMSKEAKETDINYSTGVKVISVTTDSGVKKSKKEKLNLQTLKKLSEVNQNNRWKID